MTGETKRQLRRQKKKRIESRSTSKSHHTLNKKIPTWTKPNTLQQSLAMTQNHNTTTNKEGDDNSKQSDASRLSRG